MINRYTNNRQHCFRNNRGTHTTLALFHKTLVNNKHVHHLKTDEVLGDISKAVDKVWRNGLKFKMNNLELHPCFLRTFCNFVNNRTASTKTNNYISPPFRLLSAFHTDSVFHPRLTGLSYTTCLSPSETLTTSLTLTLSPELSHARVTLQCLHTRLKEQ